MAEVVRRAGRACATLARDRKVAVEEEVPANLPSLDLDGARMEQALTVYGLPRKPAEAPYEYLHRVARELEAEGPVEALTELFEEAKFSEHSVDE